MKNKSQDGFSLIEMLIVCVIIGIIAAISIPLYTQARSAAENGSAVAHLSIMRQNQAAFYAQNRRFADMNELNRTHGNLGTVVSTSQINRGAYVFTLDPLLLTNNGEGLRTEYRIFATRAINRSVPFVFFLNQSGEINRVAPTPGSLD